MNGGQRPPAHLPFISYMQRFSEHNPTILIGIYEYNIPRVLEFAEPNPTMKLSTDFVLVQRVILYFGTISRHPVRARKGTRA